jgi:hypothetical protein
VIRARRVSNMLPVLEGVLTGFGRHLPPAAPSRGEPDARGRSAGLAATPAGT